MEILALHDNNITDLSALAELTSDTSFIEVDLSYNQISDISSLKDFDFPFVIRLAGNPIDWEDENNLAIRDRILDKYPDEYYSYFPPITETPTPSPSPSPIPTAAVSPVASINSEVISSQAESDPLIDWRSPYIIIILVVTGSVVLLIVLCILKKK